jgi:hypothetical protein
MKRTERKGGRWKGVRKLTYLAGDEMVNSVKSQQVCTTNSQISEREMEMANQSKNVILTSVEDDGNGC